MKRYFSFTTKCTLIGLVICLCITMLPIQTYAVSAGDGTYLWPVKTQYGITTGYYYKDGSCHYGADFGSPIGGPVYTVADGTVVSARDKGCLGSHGKVTSGACSLGTSCQAYKDSPNSNGSYANYIVIDHGNNVYSLYAHLKAGSFNVSQGQTVRQGQQIACSGNAGNTAGTTGAHLHFELRIGGNSQLKGVDVSNYLTMSNLPNPIPPDPTPNNEVDTRFNGFVPFTTYAVSTSNVTVFDSSLQQKGTINGSSTVITVNAVYTNGYCNVSYSGSSGQCLILSGDLIPNGRYFTVKTAANKQTSYRRSTGTDQIGSSSYVDKGDKCLVVGESNSRYQLIYPTSNSHKMGWVSTAVFDSVPDPTTPAPDPDPAFTDVHFVREPAADGRFELYAAASNCQIIDWYVTCLTCGDVDSGQLNAGGQSFVYACECGHDRFRTSLIPGGNQNAAHYVTFGGESGVVTFPINHNPVGWLDDAIGGYNKITVRGWAFDTDALDSALRIRIYLDGAYVFTAQTGTHRPDIQIKYPQVGEYHGFEAQFDATAYPGKHKLQVYAINEVYGSDTLIGERDIEVIVDTTPPQISNIRVLDVCKGGFTIQCTAADNVAVNRVMVGAWSTAGGQDDLDASWKTSEACKALQDGNTYYFHVNTADHNNDSGTYNFIVKAFDEAENESVNNSNTVTIPAFSTRENNAPVVEDVQVVNVDSDGFTIVCKVSDDTGICRVQIPSWSSPNNTEADKDDMARVWEYNKSVAAQKNNDTYSIRVNKADHGSSQGRYCFQIAAYDEFENRTLSKQYEAFIPTAALSEIQAYGITSDGFILSCKAKPLFDSKIARVQYAVWSDKGGTDDLKGGWAASEECAAYRSGDDFFYYVSLADHKNDTGKYYYWIYCYDEQGNCTAYKDGEIDVPAYSGGGVDDPLIENIQVSDITSEGFTISCKVTDADGISRVVIPVWSSPNNTDADKDDLAYRWYWNPQCNAEKNGDTYTLRVNYADHGYQRGRYCFWISAYDSRNRNTIAKQYEAFIPTAELSEMQAYGFTSDGFILSCKAKPLSDSKIARVQYAVWSSKGGTDDLKGGWAASEECAAYRSGDDFFYYVSLADHNNDTGKYYYWIYCYDEKGNCTAYKDGEIDVPAYSGGGVDDPLIQNIQVSDITSEGFTISCKVTDADGISHVAIPVWSSPNNTEADKDDVAYRWYWNPQCNAEKNGDTYTLRVNYADHGYQRGRYCYWISAYDSRNRNTIAQQYEAFIPTAALSEIQAYGITSDGFILSCKAKPLFDSKIARVQYAVWSGKGGTDDLKGGWAASEECAAYRSGDDFFYYVSLADHKNDTGKYYYWIYCYDEQGNCTAYKDGEINVPAYSGGGVDDPLIQNIQVSEITSEGFTISCKVTDADGISHVAIPVWSSPNSTDADKDDLAYRWYWNPQCNAEKNGDTYTLRVNYADHGYQRGRYCYWISAYDSRNRNTTAKDIAVVIPDSVLKLPGNLTIIGEEAFMGQGASVITIPSTVTEIGPRAFANCAGLAKLIFEGNPSSIADDILTGCRNVIIVTTKGSSVEAWAIKNHLVVEYGPA